MFEHRGSFFRPPDGHVVGSIPPRLHRGAGLDAQLRSCGGSQGRENLRWVHWTCKDSDLSNSLGSCGGMEAWIAWEWWSLLPLRFWTLVRELTFARSSMSFLQLNRECDLLTHTSHHIMFVFLLGQSLKVAPSQLDVLLGHRHRCATWFQLSGPSNWFVFVHSLFT